MRSWQPTRAFRGLVVLVAMLLGFAAQAQVVDDSTKVLYGPKTTRIVYERDVLRDSTRGTQLDTTLTRWPQSRFWLHDSTFQQDLGALGTASRPLLYQPNLQLGARYGRNVFDRYARDAAQVPYYDSRSPYSFFRVVQSGEGEQVFEISYSRSLKKNFSVGVAYERIASNQVLGARGRAGLVEHSNILLFGRFQTEDERYHLLFNFSNARHRAIEQGGIKPLIKRTPRAGQPDSLSGEIEPKNLFNYGAQSVYLTKAANDEARDQLYFTQTYRLLGRGLTLYHTFDAKRQYNNFSDLALQPAGPNTNAVVFYPQVLRSPSVTLDRSQFNQVENTLGVLGRTQAVEYRLYARDRAVSLTSQTLLPTATAANLELGPGAPTRNFNEVFFGGTAAFNYRTVYAVETAGELHAFSLAVPYDNYPEYWLRAAVRTGPLSGEVLRSSYAPTLTQQEFVGNHYEWRRRADSAVFKNTTSTQLTVRLRLKLPSLAGFEDQRLDASASAVNIDDLVYFNQVGVPAQAAKTARNLQILTARHRVRLGRVYFDNQGTYTRGGDVDGLRIPSLVTDSRVYYQSYIFKKALLSQVGAEVYYQAGYQPFDYSPSTQQFYQQDHFTTRSFPVANVFFAADIKTVSVFLKAAYVNQGLDYNGYFTTPYYTGYPRRLQLGVRWDFFN